jgi:hypothetical protein
MIAQAKLDAWIGLFSAYRHPPGPHALQQWLNYFGGHDENLASSVLDLVHLVSEHSIQQGYRRSLDRVSGWSPNKRDRRGRWFFAGYGSAGESGQAMLRIFREANNLTSERFQYLFVSARELPALQLTALDTVVFVDDFAGTGTQIVKSWPVTKELLGSEARTFLILCAITRSAQDRILAKTGMRVISPIVLQNQHNVFHNSFNSFNAAEKARLNEYCSRADSRNPRGYGGCGLLLVLAHRTPNNSLPILHVNRPRWRGIFPRYLVN